MNLILEPYKNQIVRWPQEGCHILAQFTGEYVVVYQAYRPEIGHFAVKNQHFGGEFSFNRMSWIKPNFLWMMFRSGWATKIDQEVILAIYLKKDFFNHVLENAYPSRNVLGLEKTEWDKKIETTHVRLQWDPDHDPTGRPLERKAIQLGLRRTFLLPFKGDGIVKIENISDFVYEQRQHVESLRFDELILPKEELYEVNDTVRSNLLMDIF